MRATTNSLSRRVFIVRSVTLTGTAAFASSVACAAPVHVDEADEVAVGLGYRHDTKSVDSKRFTKHDASQRCVDCSFFQGAPADEWAGCAMFGRKQVAANGWCSAWNKKPG